MLTDKANVSRLVSPHLATTVTGAGAGPGAAQVGHRIARRSEPGASTYDLARCPTFGHAGNRAQGPILVMPEAPGRLGRRRRLDQSGALREEESPGEGSETWMTPRCSLSYNRLPNA
jgi:hypothetical protein